ncbi:MAG: hypothetical protein QOE61_5323 [Micromonosporaceae bacterium]|nr:hypothetical protein [Micromonosporaceae bacterium]
MWSTLVGFKSHGQADQPEDLCPWVAARGSLGNWSQGALLRSPAALGGLSPTSQTSVDVDVADRACVVGVLAGAARQNGISSSKPGGFAAILLASYNALAAAIAVSNES